MSFHEFPPWPQPAVGGIVFKDDAVLLVKRGNPPGKGEWAIPGGRIKLGETLREAVVREIWEETGITVRATKPVYAFDAIVRDSKRNVRFHYVVTDLEATYVSGEPHAGDDAVAVRWAKVDSIGKLALNAETKKLLRDLYGIGNTG